MKMSKRELTFLGIGILILIIAVSSMIFSIKFLTGSINQAMNKKTLESPGVILKFQIEKAEALLK